MNVSQSRAEDSRRRARPPGPDTRAAPGESSPAFQQALDGSLRVHGDTCADIGRAHVCRNTMKAWDWASARHDPEVSSHGSDRNGGGAYCPTTHFTMTLQVNHRVAISFT
jgi:hypothetical protein